MAYTRVNWEDLPSTNTAINATNLNNMDAGIKENDEKLNGTKPINNTIYVNDIDCKNLFDLSSSKFDYVLSGTGTENSSLGFLISDYIAAQPNTTYSISRVFNSVSGAENIMRIGYYQANKTFIDRPASSDNPYTITTPSNCYYVRLSYQYQSQGQTSNDKVQLEIGSEATPYTPYKNFDNTISYLYKNSTGISGTSTGTQVTLNDDVSNYRKLELQIGQSLTSNATYVMQIDGTNGIQDMYLYNLTYNFGFKVVASGSTLTFTENFTNGWNAGSSKLYKVVGYK